MVSASSFRPHHELVAGQGGEPARWMLVLHGIYGSGKNWRTFARKLVARRPEWGAVLVDLRMHGESRGATPPHTVASAAADLATLSTELARRGATVGAICGHSFGGKVALAYRAAAADPALQTWVLDASPGSRRHALDDAGNTVAAVLRLLEAAPPTYGHRDEFVTLVAGAGFPGSLGQWLAMNLVLDQGVYRLALDVAAMRALLTDYYARDLWDTLPRAAGELRFVVAGRSSAVGDEERHRLADLAAEPGSPIHLHLVADAGHWLHMEALAPLLDLFVTYMPRL